MIFFLHLEVELSGSGGEVRSWCESGDLINLLAKSKSNEYLYIGTLFIYIFVICNITMKSLLQKIVSLDSLYKAIKFTDWYINGAVLNLDFISRQNTYYM